MQVSVIWRVDGIDGRFATMFATGNVPELTKTSQLLNKASKDIGEYVISLFGHVILDGVWMGAFELPADKLQELAAIRDRYQSFTDMSLSMGVGLEICEAQQALEHSIRESGDRITFFTDDLENEEEESSDSLDISALTKAEGSPSESSKSQEASSSDEPPPGTKDAQDAPGAPAQPQEASDQGQDQGSPPQDAKQQIIAALKEIKVAAPAIEALKDRNPQAYEAVRNTVAAMISMANGMVAKSEKVKKEELSPSETPDEESSTLDKDELGTKAKRGMPAGLPAVGAVNGTVKDGKIKDTPIDPVTTQAQPTKWHGVRSGLVTSNTTGAAVSSRRQNDGPPGGK